MSRGRPSAIKLTSGLLIFAASLVLSCATGIEDDMWGPLGDAGQQKDGGGMSGGAAGNGGAANGGSSNKGGSSNGGSSNKGGSSNGGSSNGGSSNGGSSNKGGSSNGGSSLGGSSNGGSAGVYPGCEMGSTDAVCDACFQQNCGPECATCSANYECGALLDCIQSCAVGDTICEDDCFYFYSGGVDDLLALLGSTSGCVSINCSTECAP